MCGRYTLTNPEDVAARFGLGALTETRIEPRFNVAPSQAVPVIISHDDQPTLELMRWGLQPAWMRDDTKRPPPINARSETLLERPMFRSAVPHRRCLIPANGFYEWKVVPGRKTKQPMYIRLKSGDLFAFAGLYAHGREDVGSTCVIVTTAANDVLAPIHERMPVILDRSFEEAWLDPDLDDPKAAIAALQVVPPDLLEAYPVASLVSSVRNDGPSLIEPIDADEANAPTSPRLF
jgi:putative SOS response-associated peptidase YedK